MNEAVWDRAAERYDDEIFDTIANDRGSVVHNTLDRLIKPTHLVCDFGCGVGRTLRFLAARAKQVVGVDFSAASLEIAASEASHSDNIRLLKRDLATPNRRFCEADVGLLMQVLIMPPVDLHRSILATAHRNLRSGAHLVAVVPALEAALLTYHRIGQWQQREGYSRNQAVEEMDSCAREEVISLVEGIVKISDTPTKHYLREEAVMLFRDAGFQVLEIKKVEYSWTADFEGVPEWMQDPYPWDWLVVACKT